MPLQLLRRLLLLLALRRWLLLLLHLPLRKRPLIGLLLRLLLPLLRGRHPRLSLPVLLRRLLPPRGWLRLLPGVPCLHYSI